MDRFNDTFMVLLHLLEAGFGIAKRLVITAEFSFLGKLL